MYARDQVVEDIVDSGYTMRYLKNLLLSRKPASLEICVLLQKPSRLKVRARRHQCVQTV